MQAHVVCLLLVVLLGTCALAQDLTTNTEEDYFSFTLNGDKEITILLTQVKQWKELGWKIQDSRNRDINVKVDLPPAMRQGAVGTHEIKYHAILKDDPDHILATATRTIHVLPVDQCALGLFQCSKFADCLNDENLNPRCECRKGFQGDGKTCSNINECADPHLNDCSPHAICTDTHGSYLCACKPGFTDRSPNNEVGRLCVDIDECALGTHRCSPNAICINTEGSYRCECNTGFEGDGYHCTRINQCDRNEHNCDIHAACVPTSDGFKCVCAPGWEGSGTTCTDINECVTLANPCKENAVCRNTPGSFECDCNRGYEKSQNGYCVDINECALGQADCPKNSDCFNTPGSYICTCREGFYQVGKDCEDITAPKFKLSGENPMNIYQFTEYQESGLEFVDEKTSISFLIDIPAELEGTAIHCGTYTINYEVKDNNNGQSTSKTRTVNVLPVNQCLLDPSDRNAAKCSPFANCTYYPERCQYTCVCMPGYSGDGIGPDGCIDSQPPVLIYHGDDPHILHECIVCGEVVSAQTDDRMRKAILFHAFDYTPFDKVDVSNSITVDIQQTNNPDCIIHNYKAWDAVGNMGQRSITVCKKVEDIRTIIEDMQHWYNWQIFIIKSIGYVAFITLLIVLIWEFGNRFAAFVRVFLAPLFGSPSYSDKDIAYSIWFRLLHPFASRTHIRQLVREKISYNDADDFSDGEEDDEEFDDDDDQ